MFAICALHEFRAAGMQNDGNVRNRVAHEVGEREARIGIEATVAREFDVGDHSEQVGLEARNVFGGFLVILA